MWFALMGIFYILHSFEANDQRLGRKVIAVHVGNEPAHWTFTVHGNLIRKSSCGFEGALSHEWAKIRGRIVKLPDCDTFAFRFYAQWLYSGRLHTRALSIIYHEVEINSLAQGYVLGDDLQDTTCKYIAVDAMVDWDMEHSPPWPANMARLVSCISEHTEELIAQKSCVIRNTLDCHGFIVDLERYNVLNWNIISKEGSNRSDFADADITNLLPECLFIIFPHDCDPRLHSAVREKLQGELCIRWTL